jgi:hypothetical protein
MQTTNEIPTPCEAESREESWRVLLKANCNSLFQTALLLSADPETAQTGMSAAIESVELLSPSVSESLANLETAVAIKTIERLGQASVPRIPETRLLVQPGLWPLLEVDQSPRICFVLRMLIGFAMSSCAQMLGIEEADARALLHVALIQLCHASQEVNVLVANARPL